MLSLLANMVEGDKTANYWTSTRSRRSLLRGVVAGTLFGVAGYQIALPRLISAADNHAPTDLKTLLGPTVVPTFSPLEENPRDVTKIIVNEEGIYILSSTDKSDEHFVYKAPITSSGVQRLAKTSPNPINLTAPTDLVVYDNYIDVVGSRSNHFSIDHSNNGGATFTNFTDTTRTGISEANYIQNRKLLLSIDDRTWVYDPITELIKLTDLGPTRQLEVLGVRGTATDVFYQNPQSGGVDWRRFDPNTGLIEAGSGFLKPQILLGGAIEVDNNAQPVDIYGLKPDQLLHTKPVTYIPDVVSFDGWNFTGSQVRTNANNVIIAGQKYFQFPAIMSWEKTKPTKRQLISLGGAPTTPNHLRQVSVNGYPFLVGVLKSQGAFAFDPRTNELVYFNIDQAPIMTRRVMFTNLMK